jgi:hypothetical protein
LKEHDMSTKPLTEREDNAIAQLFDTAAEVLESPRHRLDPDLRACLKSALDEMQAARKAANPTPTR